MSVRRPLPLTYESRVWIGVFAAACVLVTAYTRLIDAASGGENSIPIGLGFAFSLIPLSLAAIPSGLRAAFFRSGRCAAQLRKAGDLRAALIAYRQQYDILRRHTWLEAIRGYIFLERRPEVGLREETLIQMALIAYDLREGQQAANYAWRCLGFNPHHAEALALLERIRALPHEGIVGW